MARLHSMYAPAADIVCVELVAETAASRCQSNLEFCQRDLKVCKRFRDFSS
jgi:hypothetical protein